MVTLRHFRSDDLNALYAISLATGQAGGDAASLYTDPKLLGHIYSAPYALLEPELTLVAEDGLGVAGFALGVFDTAAWERRLEQDWWPWLRDRYGDPDAREAHAWNADQRRAAMIHHPRATPQDVIATHGAHLHLNLLPRAQGRGVGARLFAAWRDLALDGQVEGLHVGVNPANLRAKTFWSRQGFTPLDTPAQQTVWMGRKI
jgi:GNAT superfamily N-acetyltransferase